MPELPEVESFRRYFETNSLDKKVEKVSVHDKKVLSVSEEDLKKAIVGNKFKSTSRLGKNLIVHLSTGNLLTIHFGMTGYLQYFSRNEDLPKFSRVVFHFSKEHSLSFVCRRKFGRIDLAEDIKNFQLRKQIGPDAMELSFDDFYEVFYKKNSILKAGLLDQSNIAGIGNWLADEIAFQAKLHPGSPFNKLSRKDYQTIHKKMREIINIAIDERSDYSKFPDNFFVNYRKEDTPCPRCEGLVQKISLAGRTTYFCPSCQK
ncbi:DNA-formamidopyrimidine glycosylase [soil metagenome]